MGSEDLVSPVEEGSDDLFELGEGVVLVGGDELTERLVGGLFVSCGGVDAVEMLVEPPGVGKLRMAPEDPLQPLPLLRVEPVFSPQLQVAGPEHLGSKGRSGAVGSNPLDSSSHFDQSGGEPVRHMKPVDHVGGVTQVLTDGGPVGLRAVADPPPSPAGTRSMSWLIAPPVLAQVAQPPMSTASGTASRMRSRTARLRSVNSGG